MIRSMTGFGSAADAVEGVEFSVEVRAVNHRYLKVVVKVPEGFTEAEAEFERVVRRHLSRGSVALTVRMRLPDEQAAYRVNSAVLSAYLEQLRGAEMEANPMLRVDLGGLLELPGVCEPPPLEDIYRRTREGLLALAARACEALERMRAEEGKTIAADLAKRCDEIEEHLGVVAERAPDVVKQYHRRLADRVAELTNAGSVQIDAESLAREVAIFAERSDIAEEVSRLRGHLEQFRQALQAREAVGRKLDFISQEMLREANTIASKANDAEIGRRVVEIKTAVDRIKEQAQNVE